MADASQIKEHMEVIGADGEHVGVVDRVESEDAIKLTRDDPAANGHHHVIPSSWVSSVDDHVHLSVSSDDVFENWIEV